MNFLMQKELWSLSTPKKIQALTKGQVYVQT